MNNLETRLEEKIKYLYVMLAKYEKLNGETNNIYTFRNKSIERQIEVLQELRDDGNSKWDFCYEADVKQVNK